MPDGCVIGVDLGGTKLLAGALDSDLGVRHRAHRVVADLGRAELLDAIVDAVEELRAAEDVPLRAVAVGVPGLIDRRTGAVVESNHLPLAGVDVAGALAERLGLPVAIDNDGNLTALAELRFGAARGARDAVVLAIGTGIAGGLIFGGEVYRGAVGGAGELGHVVIDAGGRACPGACPGRGCLEAYVSGPALGLEGARLAGKHPASALARAAADGREITGALVTELAADGDAAAVDAVAAIGRWLGFGLISLINLLNPEVIVVGGGVIAAGDLLLDPARAVVAAHGLPFARGEARIVRAHFGAEAGMVGAGALALDRAGAAGP